MADGHGGARRGSGRKPGLTDAFYTSILDAHLKPRFEEIVVRLVNIATDSRTDPKVAVGACTYLLDRVLGKPGPVNPDGTQANDTLQVVYARIEARDPQEVEKQLKAMGVDLSAGAEEDAFDDGLGPLAKTDDDVEALVPGERLVAVDLPDGLDADEVLRRVRAAAERAKAQADADGSDDGAADGD